MLARARAGDVGQPRPCRPCRRLPSQWYDRERPALGGDALAAIKHALDSAGILNSACSSANGRRELALGSW